MPLFMINNKFSYARLKQTLPYILSSFCVSSHRRTDEWYV